MISAVDSAAPSIRPITNTLMPSVVTMKTGNRLWINSLDVSINKLTKPSAQMLGGMCFRVGISKCYQFGWHDDDRLKDYWGRIPIRGRAFELRPRRSTDLGSDPNNTRKQRKYARHGALKPINQITLFPTCLSSGYFCALTTRPNVAVGSLSRS